MWIHVFTLASLGLSVSAQLIQQRPAPFGVTLGVFSGAADPDWDLSNSDWRFYAVRNALSRVTPSSAPLASRLGYRGFVVTQGDTQWSINRGSNRNLELLMLQTGAGSINDDLYNSVLADITGRAPSPPEASPITSLFSIMSPMCNCECDCRPYQPWLWNTFRFIRRRNNCYNYATNRQTNTFAQPGRATGRMYAVKTVAEVRDAAVRDGLCDLGNPLVLPSTDACLLALVVRPYMDFHWYRQDCNGLWSHKPGRTPATNLDNSGNLIFDPRSADVGPYQFAGFFAQCPFTNIVRK